MTSKEAGQILGVSPGVVRVRLTEPSKPSGS